MAASPPKAFPYPYDQHDFPNGLRLITVPTDYPNVVALYIVVQTGSRNEVEPGKSGFAHLFEHMMFRGTKAYPPAKYEAVLKEAGAASNAYTTDDLTAYHTTFSKEDLETILRMEADRFQNLDYTEAAFRTETLAVLGEYNKNSASPSPEAGRGAARHGLRQAHLQAHHHGLPEGHPGHAQPVRLQPPVLRPLLPARVHHHHRGRRRHAKPGADAGGEVLGRVEARQLPAGHSGRAAAQRPRAPTR